LTNIFLIEDDPIISRTTEWRITRLGYTCCGIADNGPDAIAKINASSPDVILIDITLRGPMDGIAIADHLGKNTEIPYIFLTGSVDAPTLAQAKATNPRGYLVKPFDDNNLKAAIEMALK
jgi:CheY-like chemotaxis protein